MTKTTKQLIKLLNEAMEPGMFAPQDRSGITAPEDAEVKALCERHGYGAVMDSASRQWEAKGIEKHGITGMALTVTTGNEVRRRWCDEAKRAVEAAKRENA